MPITHVTAKSCFSCSEPSRSTASNDIVRHIINSSIGPIIRDIRYSSNSITIGATNTTCLIYYIVIAVPSPVFCHSAYCTICCFFFIIYHFCLFHRLHKVSGVLPRPRRLISNTVLPPLAHCILQLAGYYSLHKTSPCVPCP